MSLESTRTVNVSVQNIKDQVAALLDAFGEIKDNQEITTIDFGDIVIENGVEIVPITYKVKERMVNTEGNGEKGS
jgi:hypothetical protein